jgi:hypothetical protein
MTNRNTILSELQALGSSLAHNNPQNCYVVPEGYFDGLASQIVNRIRAMELSDVKEELNQLSPLLGSISNKMPFDVPAAYFENLSERLLQGVRDHEDYQTIDEEIKHLSPLLGGLKNKNPYSVPKGYFEKLEPVKEKNEAKIISIAPPRRWYRLAVAAVFIGVIAIGGLLFINQNKVDPNKNPQAWIEKNVKKKVNETQLDEFVKLSGEDELLKTEDENGTLKTDEIKALMKDVSEKEIQDFLNDAVALESNDDINALMN